jgi:hypothetical protein
LACLIFDVGGVFMGKVLNTQQNSVDEISEVSEDIPAYATNEHQYQQPPAREPLKTVKITEVSGNQEIHTKMGYGDNKLEKQQTGNRNTNGIRQLFVQFCVS